MVSKDRILRHVPGNPKIRQRPIIAVETNCDERGGFLSAEYRVDSINESTHTFYTPGSMLYAFLVTKYWGYEMLIHHADHDMAYFLPTLELLAAQGYIVNFTMNGSEKMIYVRITKGKHSWYIRDTFALLPMSVDDMRTLAGTLPGCPTVKVLIQAYKALSKTLLKTFTIRPMHTIASTSMRAFQTTIPPHHIHYRQRPVVEECGRAAYYGGMMFQTTDLTVFDVTKIDTNAMYAHAMRQGVPTRAGTWTHIEREGKPGVYYCIVTPPRDCAFPFVPYRDPDNNRTVYPERGTFQTALCSNTMQTARDFGYQIDITSGYVFDGIDYVFDQYIDKCEELELEYRDLGARQVIKLLRNSLYGKFGQKTKAKEYYLTTDPDDTMTFVLTWRGEVIPNLWWKTVDIKRPYLQPVWAAWITSQARDTLTRMVYALGPQSCYYGDTDSIVVKSVVSDQYPIPISRKYGDWKVDGKYSDFRVIAPKSWIGRTTEGDLQSVEYRIGGIPRQAFGEAEIQTLLDNGRAESKPYYSHVSAINTTGGRPTHTPMQKTVELFDLSTK